MLLKKIFNYFFGHPNYDINQHWREQSKKEGLESVMFWCKDYNFMADAVEKKEIMKHLDNIKGKRILDVDCGIGRLSKFLAQKGALVTGIDIAPMVEKAKRKNAHKNIRYIAVSAFEMDFPRSTFDFVLSVATIALISDTDEKLFKIFKKISEVLKKEGLFLCLEPFHKHIFKRPCQKSAKEIIKLAEIFNLQLIYKRGILNFTSRIIIENFKKISFFSEVSLKKFFYFGEAILKIPLIGQWFSDYKVIIFGKI